MLKRIAILGSTGSIGHQAVEIVKRYPESFDVTALSCMSSVDELLQQVRDLNPEIVCLGDEEQAERFSKLAGDSVRGIDVVHSTDGLGQMVQRPGIDCVLNALVGFAGLYPSLKAVEAGKTLCLANKESLVMGGPLVRNAMESSGTKIIPVDSEHSAIFQCIDSNGHGNPVDRVILTASGGPFRKRPKETFDSITLEETLNHPTWKMGPKITVDSATLFNKGFEMIEAGFLFDLVPEKIETVIHPQSIVHSMVEFEDGSVISQMSYPTMEIPIQYALTFPDRKPTRVKQLDLADVGALTFEKPDELKFPALRLSREALERGGTATALLNLGNDEAVKHFLAGRLSFCEITESVSIIMEKWETIDEFNYDDIVELKKMVESHFKELTDNR